MSNKRKADYERQCVQNEKAIKRQKRRMDRKTDLDYFRACLLVQDFKTCRALLSKDSDDYCDYLGHDTIQLAFRDPKVGIWEFLINEGVSVEVKQITATGWAPILTKAAECNNYDLVVLLVENRVDINARDCYGKTALMYAAKNHNIEMMKYLGRYHANPHIEDKENKNARYYALGLSTVCDCIEELMRQADMLTHE
jgi:ankyrin repeat protein